MRSELDRVKQALDAEHTRMSALATGLGEARTLLEDIKGTVRGFNWYAEKPSDEWIAALKNKDGHWVGPDAEKLRSWRDHSREAMRELWLVFAYFESRRVWAYNLGGRSLV